jgi:ring-1,2-phenylacetyl-CoA epoxidase subunit PaaA
MDRNMPIEEYLAQGGVLTAPANCPPRYRAELLRLMASFVDSEMAAAAGFAERINDAPSIRGGSRPARIVLEKTAHAERVLGLMAEFGADMARYDAAHPWAARLPRDADLGAARHGGDMRLALFHYPLDGWVDAVVMHLLMGRAVGLQLAEYARASYRPLAEALGEIAPVEARHTELAADGVRSILARGGADAAQAALAYWVPRVGLSFGRGQSDRFARLAGWGLRHRPNAALAADWAAATAAEIRQMGLRWPDPDPDEPLSPLAPRAPTEPSR